MSQELAFDMLFSLQSAITFLCFRQYLRHDFHGSVRVDLGDVNERVVKAIMRQNPNVPKLCGLTHFSLCLDLAREVASRVRAAAHEWPVLSISLNKLGTAPGTGVA